ncbi:MAG TPA: NAD(P)H-hydrate epimerase, partial [Desulfomonilia bacterium]|nr:NAD(P)H-hydrate epimerase [Desulfomonilia bacterium]
MKVGTVSEMRAMDKDALEIHGIPELLLMENAGLASYEVLVRESGIKGKTIIVLAGIGNNGGD